MLRFFSRAVPLVVLSIMAGGCYAGSHHHGHAHHGHGDGLLVAAAIVAGAAIVASSSEPPRREEPVYVQPVVYVSAPAGPAPPPSPRDRIAKSDATPFDAKGARAALAEVDLSSCRALGAPRGYGHAKVTFNPDGKVSKVVVDTPSGLEERAAHCVGDRLGTASVAEYRGSLVTVGTTWFVP